MTKTIPKKQKFNKTKWLSEEALQVVEKRREVKGQRRKGKLCAAEAMPENAQTTAQLHSSHTQVMLKILQARLQQYVNRELPDVQAGFRKGRGTRDQIANIC